MNPSHTNGYFWQLVRDEHEILDFRIQSCLERLGTPAPKVLFWHLLTNA